MSNDKITWRYYPSNNSSGVYHICKRGNNYIGQYQVQADGRIVAHAIKDNRSSGDIISVAEARKYIITEEEPIVKPPLVPKQQTLPTLTQEEELARQQRMAGGDDDDTLSDDEVAYYARMRSWGAE